MEGSGQVGWGGIIAGDAVVGSACMKTHNDYRCSCGYPAAEWN